MTLTFFYRGQWLPLSLKTVTEDHSLKLRCFSQSQYFIGTDNNALRMQIDSLFYLYFILNVLSITTLPWARFNRGKM